MINISRKHKETIIQDLQEWFQENLDHEQGSLDDEFLFDFFTKNVGGFYYNQALTDVPTLIYEKTESLADSIYDLTKDTLTN